MILSKEEFKVLVMLYAANADGNIQPEEVKVMLEKNGFDVVEKTKNLFSKMSDTEVIECIRENKAIYAATENDRLDLIHDLCAIIEADDQCTIMERATLNAMRRLLG